MDQVNKIVICENISSTNVREYRVAICDVNSLYVEKNNNKNFVSPVIYLETFGNSKTYEKLTDALHEVAELQKKNPDMEVTSITLRTSFDTFIISYWTYFVEDVLPQIKERAKDNFKLYSEVLERTITNYAAIHALRRHDVASRRERHSRDNPRSRN
jgi:hypothetical protein